MNHVTIAVLFLIAAIVSYVIAALNKLGRREAFLPPGPPTVPIFGNALSYPTRKPHYRFTKWAKQYGDVFSLKFGSRTIVVLSSASAVRDILDKRSATTSDRPGLIMEHSISGGKNMILAPYGSEWRRMRRAAHAVLTPQSCTDYLPIQRAEATQLMYDLLTQPRCFITSIKRYSSSVIMSVLFGQRSPSFDSPATALFFEQWNLLQEALAPGIGYFAEIIPAIGLFPEFLSPWKALSSKVRILQRRLYFGLLDEVERRRKEDKRNGCFMETVCANAKAWGLDREALSYLGGALIEGGSETTSCLLASLILALVVYPEVQEKARDELDRVVGCGRVPSLEDMDQLPYCEAIMKEVHRWRPVVPLAPHATTADEWYNGYLIPKGSWIIQNIWGIFHDPVVYDEPERFNPDRFLREGFGLKQDDQGKHEKYWRDTFMYGSGRRICPGVHLANNSMRINITNLLWAFEFLNDIDPVRGEDIVPDVHDYTKGLTYGPRPFPCRIIVRSQQHADLIRQAFSEAQSVFEPFEAEPSHRD